MPKRVLDTNVLINHWRDSIAGRRLRDMTSRMAIAWGDELATLEGSSAILTPTYVEFMCGVASRHELQLARSYLGRFKIVDNGFILKQDWDYARQLAQRVPLDGLARQMGDCLMRALCERLHLEFVTREIRYPHRLTGPRPK